eukprot:3935280-Alexandrium_andersonii.AAC.1
MRQRRQWQPPRAQRWLLLTAISAMAVVAAMAPTPSGRGGWMQPDRVPGATGLCSALLGTLAWGAK